MTSPATPPGADAPGGAAPAGDGRLHVEGRSLGDRLYRGAITLFALCVPVLLLLIAIEVGVAGWPTFRESGVSFLFESVWDPGNGLYVDEPHGLVLARRPPGGTVVTMRVPLRVIDGTAAPREVAHA